MKVHAFKVERTDESSPLEDVFSLIERERNLRERIRIINQAELRAETVELRDDVWLIDFVRIRTDHGPGRVSRDAEVEGFDFDDEEGFGEETAALYDPASGYILVQYNHFGVRAGVIADYLSAFDGTSNNLYTFKPKYDEDVERRLLNQGITRKVAFTLDVSKMSAQDRQRGQALSEAISYGREAGADKIKVEISVSGERQRGLADKAKEGIASLQNILGQNPDAVTKLEVAGREERDSVTEVLDLIGHRLSSEFNDLRVGADLRYPREERWRALLRAKNGWSRILR
ncbi:DUF6731 family protein [Neptuniibacter sp. 1_MG-2023]|uniref:DUF6731 family protein n=1 Tax=Neptuniibacter sp. 1_MG-2023 TaxID=3062662 RepID=UPI0026E45CCF|nr:DUF6731 family protein [Neptuniibacter sp. 1_MG-2023]MDO6594681.1 hypothetical protein [Neptuniibacter sp. 1_MG-2023]